MTYYERNLPHWLPEHATFFVTWRLHGSLPLHRRTAGKGCGTSAESRKETAGHQFARIDYQLDRARCGPHWLKEPKIAGRVVELMKKGDEQLGYFSLYAFVVMPNHVHILFAPKIELKRIMNGLKGTTAREANRILERTGKAFWQDESYDHCVRSDEEFGKIGRYIENNPVSAGLVKRPEEWPWSSAAKSRNPTDHV